MPNLVMLAKGVNPCKMRKHNTQHRNIHTIHTQHRNHMHMHSFSHLNNIYSKMWTCRCLGVANGNMGRGFNSLSIFSNVVTFKCSQRMDRAQHKCVCFTDLEHQLDALNYHNIKSINNAIVIWWCESPTGSHGLTKNSGLPQNIEKTSRYPLLVSHKGS